MNYSQRIADWLGETQKMLEKAGSLSMLPPADIFLQGACQYLQRAKSEAQSYFFQLMLAASESQRNEIAYVAGNECCKLDALIGRIQGLRARW